MDFFERSWTALRGAVAELSDEDFDRPSGCAGWRVRDLVCHLVIDAQDVLITLATPSDAEPTRDAATYWTVGHESPSPNDPLGALTTRLAAAYGDPSLLTFHLDDVGAAAGRAAASADRARPVETQGFVLTTGDYLDAYVLEWTLHHVDLVVNLPGVPGPPSECADRARRLFESVVGTTFPDAMPDVDVLRVGTGRRAPTDAEHALLGTSAERLPFVLG